VLDLTPGRLSEAIVHVRRALESTDARLDELRIGLDQNEQPADTDAANEAKPDSKGKGKAPRAKLIRNPVSSMTKAQIEAEIKDLEEVRGDLQLKVCLAPSVCRYIYFISFADGGTCFTQR
jgi:HAT1-interacting factor 1